MLPVAIQQICTPENRFRHRFFQSVCESVFHSVPRLPIQITTCLSYWPFNSSNATWSYILMDDDLGDASDHSSFIALMVVRMNNVPIVRKLETLASFTLIYIIIIQAA